MILFDQKSFSLSPDLIYNKTAMKKIYLLLALFMGVCAFTACSDDDKEDAKTNELVGTWEVTHEWLIDSDGNITEEDFPIAGEDVYILEANGKGTNIYTGYGFSEEITFTYTYENKRLTIVFEDVEEGTIQVTTFNVTIKGNVATLKTTEADEVGEYDCLELKKIK